MFSPELFEGIMVGGACGRSCLHYVDSTPYVVIITWFILYYIYNSPHDKEVEYIKN